MAASAMRSSLSLRRFDTEARTSVIVRCNYAGCAGRDRCLRRTLLRITGGKPANQSRKFLLAYLRYRDGPDEFTSHEAWFRLRLRPPALADLAAAPPAAPSSSAASCSAAASAPLPLTSASLPLTSAPPPLPSAARAWRDAARWPRLGEALLPLSLGEALRRSCRSSSAATSRRLRAMRRLCVAGSHSQPAQGSGSGSGYG